MDEDNVDNPLLVMILKQHRKEIDELKAHTSTQQDAIDSLKNKLTEQKQNISSNKKMIERNENSHKTDISKLEKKAEVSFLSLKVLKSQCFF